MYADLHRRAFEDNERDTERRAIRRLVPDTKEWKTCERCGTRTVYLHISSDERTHVCLTCLHDEGDAGAPSEDRK